MRTAAMWVCALGLCACAGQQQLEPISAPREELVGVTTGDGSQTYNVRITRENFVARSDLEAPLDSVVAALPLAFELMGLPVPVIDPATHTARIEDHRVSRRLRGVPLSRYLECGNGIAGEYANTHLIRLNVTTALDANGADSTIVRTRVEAVAMPTGGAGGTRRCTTIGTLELGLAELLHAAVTRTGN